MYSLLCYGPSYDQIPAPTAPRQRHVNTGGGVGFGRMNQGTAACVREGTEAGGNSIGNTDTGTAAGTYELRGCRLGCMVGRGSYVSGDTIASHQ
jgi:hypothetical protein